MESYQEEERFGGVQAKNSSEEARRRWRRLSTFVRNPKRRFHFGEVEALERTNHTDYALSIYMEYASKGSIHALLAKFGPFKESLIRTYTAQILSGLAFLHERRHIHRDIKGANILVGPNDEVKLADFGLAKHIATLTEVHTSNKGTIYWMAPEVILSSYSGKGYNLSADIWSLGCTVIEMATGKPPLRHLEPVAAMFKIASNKYMPEIPDNLSDEGKNFLQLCLQRDPARLLSAAALVDHPFTRNQEMSFLESNVWRPLSFNIFSLDPIWRFCKLFHP